MSNTPPLGIVVLYGLFIGAGGEVGELDALGAEEGGDLPERVAGAVACGFADDGGEGDDAASEDGRADTIDDVVEGREMGEQIPTR